MNKTNALINENRQIHVMSSCDSALKKNKAKYECRE